MNAKQKIKIDRVAGGLFCYLLNIAAKAIGAIARRSRHIDPETVRTVVVAKYAGMGSILSALPLLQALKRRYPRAEVIFITSEKNADLVERIRLIDRSWYVSEQSLIRIARTTLSLVWRLWRVKTPLFIDLELYSNFSSMVATLSLARRRIGFYRLSASVKKGLFTDLIFFNAAAPVHLLYLQLGAAAGCDSIVEFPSDPLAIRPGDDVAGSKALNGWRPDTVMVVNVNASDLSLERRWPIENFARTITRLLEDNPELRVVLTGSRAERDYTGRLQEMLRDYHDRVSNQAGELSLGGFLALIRDARCVLTNDSGPMHMALALDRPTVALFGPVSPQQFAGTSRRRFTILYEPVVCSPCVHHVDEAPCGGDNQCMKLIRVESVIAACCAFLDDDGSEAVGLQQQWSAPSQTPVRSLENGLVLGQVKVRSQHENERGPLVSGELGALD